MHSGEEISWYLIQKCLDSLPSYRLDLFVRESTSRQGCRISPWRETFVLEILGFGRLATALTMQLVCDARNSLALRETLANGSGALLERGSKYE